MASIMAKIILESNFNKKELVESLDRVLFNYMMRCMDYAQTGIIPDNTDANDALIIRDLLINLTEAKEGK
jgi:hypothetical protein|uniref:Uncharacterized protein n=1 Tax=virus sp. ctuWX8 TaxID=2826816 RepID=A0A8S5R7V1_9VIRU|nr:MAG TPA: hypothetical protein [virus sp. ctuWX8]